MQKQTRYLFALTALLAAFAFAGCQHKSNPPTAPQPIELLEPSTPWGAAASSDGTEIYVANNTSAEVLVVNASTHAIVRSIKTLCSPRDLAVSPDGSLLFVTHDKYETCPSGSPLTNEPDLNSNTPLSVIDLSQNKVVQELDMDAADNLKGGNDSREIIVAPTSGMAYIANLQNNLVVMDIDNIDQDSLSTIKQSQFEGGSNGGAHSLELSPDESILYVTNVSERAVDLIDTSTLQKHANGPITLGSACKNMADLLLDGAGKYLYATCQGENPTDRALLDDDRIRRVDLEDDSKDDLKRVCDRPGKMLFNADESQIFVLCQGSGEIAIVDAASFEAAGTVDGNFGFPTDAAIANGTAFVTDALNNRIRFFDAEGQ